MRRYNVCYKTPYGQGVMMVYAKNKNCAAVEFYTEIMTDDELADAEIESITPCVSRDGEEDDD